MKERKHTFESIDCNKYACVFCVFYNQVDKPWKRCEKNVIIRNAKKQVCTKFKKIEV